MTLLERRRQMMARKTELEEWDLVLKARADGTIEPTNVSTILGQLQRNQTVRVAWDMTGYDGKADRVLVVINGATTLEKDLPTVTGEITHTNTSYANETVLVSRSWGNRTGPTFMGRYIKVRYEN